MDTNEFITKVNEHLKYIKELYAEAHPQGKYLTFSLINGEWMYSNEYWDKDSDFPVIYPPRNDMSTPVE